MAIGFPPSYTQEYSINDYSKEDFFAIIIEAFKRLKWVYTIFNSDELIAQTSMSWESWGESITVRSEYDTFVFRSECSGQIIDWGKNKRNLARLSSKINEIISEWDADELANHVELYKNSIQQLNINGEIQDNNKVLYPNKGVYISIILIGINFFVFVLMLLNGVHFLTPNTLNLLNWGANFGPNILEGEYWRLFTACFIHIGFVHLLMNVYALYYIGSILEPYLGKFRFLSAYIFAGITSSLISVCWHENSISAGASGAIFGMYGVFLALISCKVFDKTIKRGHFLSILLFVIYNILYGLQANSGIDNAAHIGGLVSGIFIGFLMVPSLKKENIKYAYIYSGILFSALLVSIPMISRNLSNDVSVFQKNMIQFVELERKALEIYSLPENTPNDKILVRLQDGLKNWQEAEELLKSTKSLNLPDLLHQRNDKLLNYTQLRIQSFKLLNNLIIEEDEKYLKEIEEINAKMEEILNGLN